MNIRDACHRIGTKAKLHIPMNQSNIVVPVKILDVRQRWGKTDFQITPENGAGEVWVESSRIIFE